MFTMPSTCGILILVMECWLVCVGAAAMAGACSTTLPGIWILVIACQWLVLVAPALGRASDLHAWLALPVCLLLCSTKCFHVACRLVFADTERQSIRPVCLAFALMASIVCVDSLDQSDRTRNPESYHMETLERPKPKP